MKARMEEIDRFKFCPLYLEITLNTASKVSSTEVFCKQNYACAYCSIPKSFLNSTEQKNNNAKIIQKFRNFNCLKSQHE